MTNPMTDAEMYEFLDNLHICREFMSDEECETFDRVIDSLRVRVEAEKYDGLSKCCKSVYTHVYDPDLQYECCKCDARCDIYEDKDHA